MRVDTRDVDRVLKLGIKLHKNSRKFLALVGRNEINMSRNRIRTTKKDPDGRRWQSWAPATADSRRKKGTASRGLLFDGGYLYNHFTSHATRNRVTVSNRAPYASYLQNGTSRMPARPFMGWSDDSVKGIRNIYRKHLKRWK